MLKWKIVAIPGGYGIYNRNTHIVTMLNLKNAEKIVAAHNAVIDMAFDSPGNVS